MEALPRTSSSPALPARLAPFALAGAALCFAPLAAAQPVPRECVNLPAQEPVPTAADPRDRDAEVRQWRALRLFCVGNYEASSSEFLALYALREGNPNRYRILFFLARNAERQRRYDEAIQYYQRYLSEGPPDAPNRETVQSAIETLGNLLGTVRVTANIPGAELWVDERRVGPLGPSVRLAGGRHVVELRASGYASARREVTVEAGATLDVQLRLEALSQRRGLPVAGFGLTVAVAGAALLTTVGLGLAVVVEHGRGAALLANSNTMAQWTTQDADRLRALGYATDAALGATVALAAVAVVVGRFTEFRRPEGVATARRERPWVVPVLGAHPGLAAGVRW